MSNDQSIASPSKSTLKPGEIQVPFGVNEVRLSGRQWIATVTLFVLIVLSIPWLWTKVDRFKPGTDYRIPYQLSKDYWLYSRLLREAANSHQILVLGDSVVWGEYVLPDGTLSHFLNREAGEPDRFDNAGVNGMFPLALEGLVRYYGQPLHERKIILHCNVLWMTSPEHDLSTDKEEPFNHSRLVPQFTPRVPCYRADASERLTALIERQVPFIGWVNHLQNAFFDQKSILSWTLADNGGTPLQYPNSYKNPLAAITLRVPIAAANDADRGPSSPRHKPWTEKGENGTRYDWVPLNKSLQWQAFQRLVKLLRQRHNDLLVVVGPFNEHMMVENNRPVWRSIRDGVASWMAQNDVPCIVPETLPKNLYADPSHPLTEGYSQLAKDLYANAVFRDWLNKP